MRSEFVPSHTSNLPEYKYWSRQEICSLVSAVEETQRPNGNADWEAVSRRMQPRSPQQCKSYYLMLRNTKRLKEYQQPQSGARSQKTEEYSRQALLQQASYNDSAKKLLRVTPLADQMLVYALEVRRGEDVALVQEAMPKYTQLQIQQIYSYRKFLFGQFAKSSPAEYQQSSFSLLSNKELQEWHSELLVLCCQSLLMEL